jgi:DNA polymerase
MNDLMPVSLQVNGIRYDVAIQPWRTLLEVLRETLTMTGTKRSCGEGQCGACTVLLDGKAVSSCMYLAVEAQGKEILTIEGPVGGDPALWPQQLENFSAWWLTEPSLDHGIVMERIAPRGPAGAKLMVLVDYPEADDRTSLLSGDQGKLLSAFLVAGGIPADQVYVASVLPRHTPLPDWTALGAAGLDAVTAHHVALAAPERLILLSEHISPLLGNDPANSAESLRRFNHEGRSIPVLVAAGLDDMLLRPRLKAVLWQRWLEWTGRDS